MTYNQLIAMIESYGTRHNKINHVVHGDYEDIVDITTRRSINYPALWIESPDLLLVGDQDSISQAWDVAFVVLENSDPKYKDRTRAAIDNTFIIARQIAIRMAMELGTTVRDIRIQQINTLGNDFDHGWRVNMLIPATIDETCRDMTVWSDFV